MRAKPLSVIFIVLAISGSLWAADDLLMGTWQLDLTKSKFKPGPPPKSLTHKYEPHETNGVKFASEGMDAQGEPIHSEYSANYDGTDYTVTGDPTHNSVSMRRIDAYTTEVTSRRNGQALWTSRSEVSKDGKTLTITQKGTTAQGQSVNNVLVFDKQ